MGTSAIAKINTPDITSSADFAAILLAMGRSIEPSLTPRFSSTATRDSAYTSAVFAADAFGGEGLHCWVQGIGNQTRIGGTWTTAGPILYALGGSGNGVTNPTNAVGITTGVTIAAKPYAQLIQCSWAGLVSLGGSATELVDLCLWRDGATAFAIRGFAQESTVGSVVITLAANTSTVLQLVAVKITGNTPTTFSADSRYTYLTALAIPVGAL